MNRRLISVIAGLCLICLPACGASPEEQITRVLDNRKQGLEKKDIKLYMSTVSPNYNDGGKTYDSIKRERLEDFSIFKEMKLDIQNRSIYVDGDKAQVVEKYILTFSSRSDKRTGKAEGLFIMQKEEDGWKIISGI